MKKTVRVYVVTHFTDIVMDVPPDEHGQIHLTSESKTKMMDQALESVKTEPRDPDIVFYPSNHTYLAVFPE